MKNNFLYILFTLAVNTSSAQDYLQWSDAIVVVATPLSVTAPRVALMPDGTPLITWGTSGNPSQIWCARFENNTFSTPVGVVQNPAVPSLFGFGGYDVAVAGNQVFVVFEQLQQGIMLSRSVNGGLTFEAPVIVDWAAAGGYTTLASVEVDGTGNPVVSYIHDYNGANYEVSRSTDGGATFNEPVIANAAAPGGAVCECCTSDLVASGDSLWMVFRNNNQNLRDIWVSRSTDLAASFDVATDVDATDWILNACPISGPRMARAGDTLLMAWMSRASGIGHIYLSTLHAGTMEAGPQLGFPFQPGPQNAQSQADVTASGDTIGVVFVEKAKEILCYYSTTGTTNLIHQSTRFAIPNHTLQYPSITFSNGVFHLVYLDVTSDQVLYRTGKLTQISDLTEPPYTSLKVFPNPTAEKISVKASGEMLSDVVVMDAQGRTIYPPKNIAVSGDEITIDLQQFPVGVYFILAKTKDRWFWEKAVKD